MAEENQGAPEGEGNKAATQESDANEYKAKVEALQAKLDAAERNTEVFNAINSRYKSDPAFKKKFDSLWSGSEEQQEVNDKIEEAAENISTPDKLFEKLNSLEAKLNEKIEMIGNHVAGKDLMEERAGVDSTYERAFAEVASEAGFKPGTPAYDLLLNNAKVNVVGVAKKYGLVDSKGNPDPLRAFKPEVVKESFEAAKDILTRAGYDVNEFNKKLEAKAEEERRNREKSELDQFFNKDNLKTSSGRAKALKDALSYRLRKAGIDMNSLRLNK